MSSKSSKVLQIFTENDPSGTTDLAGVLKHATDNYFQRKTSNTTQPNGETILVVTDGEPDDRKAVLKVSIDASRRLERTCRASRGFSCAPENCRCRAQ